MAQELAQHDERAVAERPASTPAAPATPMGLLQTAVDQGADMERLEKLLDLQQRWEANEARKAYSAAMSSFKADPPRIVKNNRVSYSAKGGQTEYDHATLDQISTKVSQAMAPHGLSFRWETAQSNGVITVTCIVLHRDGHSERTTLSAGADQSGGKNSIQAVGSAVTYLERYTLKAALGIAEEGADDDGQSSTQTGGAERVTQEQADQIQARLEETEIPRDPLLRSVAKKASCRPFETINDIPASFFDVTMRLIEHNYALRQEHES